jgi:transposase InsO family protein
MKQKSEPDKAPAERVVKDIRRQTRRQYSAEEKIRIVLEGLRGEENISELCRREGIAASMYYGWSKEFLEAGKRRLAGDTARAAGASRALAAGVGGALHRREKVLCLGGSVYRLLKAHDLITRPAYVVIKAANAFKDKTTAINQLWQTDFTYLKITGRGWYYLSTVLDDFSRYIVAWRLGPTMCASDVTAMLDQALAASGLTISPSRTGRGF